MLKTAFCVSGRGRLFMEAVRLQDRIGHRPSLVVLDTGADPALESFCREAGIRFERIPDVDRQKVQDWMTRVLGDASVDLIALTFNRLVPSELVQRYTGRMINTHLSLLPAFKGFGALAQAVDGGVKFGGATIHLVDDDADGGPILAQAVEAVRCDDTPETLGARVYDLLRPMFLQVIAWYAQRRVMLNPRGIWCVRDAVYGTLPHCPALEMNES